MMPVGERLEKAAWLKASGLALDLSNDFADWAYLDRMVSGLPARFVAPVADCYRNEYAIKGQYAANVWMGDIAGAVTVRGASAAGSDADLCEQAKRHAVTVSGLLCDGNAGKGYAFGVTSESVLKGLAEYCTKNGIEPPAGVELRGMVFRMTDAAWWRRQLRRTVARKVEAAAIGLGLVHRRAGLYASDETVNRHAEQKRRNLLAMENTEAVNSEGEVFNLAELAALGVGNPSVRFAELMVRVRGMEAHAKEHGDVGLFVTGTTPSHMHSRHWESCQQIELFDGTTPREAQGWMAGCWSRIRTALGRLGVRYYGVRVAEPHHDGTPHWHMLLFVRPELSPGRSAVSRMQSVIRKYLLRGEWKPGKKKDFIAAFRGKGLTVKAATLAAAAAVSAQKVAKRQAERKDEARRARACDFKLIDWAQGSAAGYLVKYLAKNISGQRMGMDDEAGKESPKAGTETASRVLAWASCWAIRQFQVVGGPPVGVWRELRKLKDQPEQLELCEAWAAVGRKETKTQAGVKPDWAAYIAAQGGIEILRADRPVQLWKLQEPGRMTKYHDAAPSRAAGVFCRSVSYRRAAVTKNGKLRGWKLLRSVVDFGETKTRETVWKLQPKEREFKFEDSDELRARFPRGEKAHSQKSDAVDLRRASRRAFDSVSPWTRVNNCTERTPGSSSGLAQNMAHIAKLPAVVPEKWFVGPVPSGRVFCLNIFDQLRELKHGTGSRKGA